MQDSAALANTDYVQLERLFQQLLRAKDAEAVTDNCLATNSCSGVSCSAAVRDIGLTKRPSDPAIVAAAAADKAAADAKRGAKPKAGSVPDKPSQQTGVLPPGMRTWQAVHMLDAHRHRNIPTQLHATSSSSFGVQGLSRGLALCIPGKASKVTGSAQRTASTKAASAASHRSGLWTKAPPKKEPTAGSESEKAVAGGRKGRAVKTSAPAPAADAEAALRAAHEVCSMPCQW